MTPPRDLDLVVYGATGFTGRQAAAYVARRGPPGLRWAVAGRDAARLAAVRGACAALVPPAGSAPAGPLPPDVLVADAHDARALDDLAARARVVLTTAGPYARHGSALVAACVARRADYVDITGETPWVRDLIDRHHAQAAADGTRVVPLCGFDSVPSDLGTWLLVEHFRGLGLATRRVRGAFRAGRGGLNGGTLASALALSEDREVARLRDPFLLNPPGTAPARGAGSRDRRGVTWDPDLRTWLAPFVMAPVNTRVVRRSAALWAQAGAPYGPDFAYEEALALARAPAAWAVAASMALADPLLRLAPARALARRLGPRPGEGPSEETMDRGWFASRYVGVAADGRRALAEVSGQGDPGNRATVTFLCEAALALACERDALPGGPARGGLLTPATAFGDVLVRRLRAAGVRLEVTPLGPS